MLEQVDADVHLVATLLSLNKVIPEKTRDTARQVVRKVVEELVSIFLEKTRKFAPARDERIAVIFCMLVSLACHREIVTCEQRSSVY